MKLQYLSQHAFIMNFGNFFSRVLLSMGRFRRNGLTWPKSLSRHFLFQTELLIIEKFEIGANEKEKEDTMNLIIACSFEQAIPSTLAN